MAYPVLLVNIPFFYAKNFKKKILIFLGDNINAVSFKGVRSNSVTWENR
jgi:hypothetical protein